MLDITVTGWVWNNGRTSERQQRNTGTWTNKRQISDVQNSGDVNQDGATWCLWHMARAEGNDDGNDNVHLRTVNAP